jgi:hypothetical protein
MGRSWIFAVLHVTATFVEPMRRETRPTLHVLPPKDAAASQKEQRRKRIAALSLISNAIYGEAFARLAK